MEKLLSEVMRAALTLRIHFSLEVLSANSSYPARWRASFQSQENAFWIGVSENPELALEDALRSLRKEGFKW